MTELSTIPISRLNNAELDTKIKTEIDKNGIDLSTIATNCITEIPQDIKLELTDGTLTLKSGSKVYVPNGFEDDGTTPKFDEVVIESDKTQAGQFNRQLFLFYDVENNRMRDMEPQYISSGSTQPTSTYALWYDTTSNLVKYTHDSGSSWFKCSFPFCIITDSSTGITSIDQVFDGFGYIGQTVFSLPGVVGLFPNGRNEDGSLKNSKYTQQKVMINSLENQSSRWCRYGYDGLVMGWGVEEIFIQDAPPTMAVNRMWYDTASNYLKIGDGSKWSIHRNIILGRLIKEGSSAQITSFTPKLPFKAVDYNDVVDSSSATDNSPRIATTAWFNNKCQFVSALPASPVSGVYYFVKE